MEKQTVFVLPTLPQESLRALERAVMPQLNWRIMTGGKDEQPKFLIEKQVQYNFTRGWTMVALHKISGSFQPNQHGQTTLQYVVAGQNGIPLLQAAINIGMLLLILFGVGLIAFSPSIGNAWIGVLLMLLLLAIMVGYGWFAYRHYQGQLRELYQFMEEFVQRMQQRKT